MPMAALIYPSPSSSSWRPEDDLLLKSSVESGASLEALAKGAVHFSQKFSVQELRDRWHSLLYDPVVSNEASTRMNKVELTALVIGSKTSRNVNSKENVDVPMKRKLESIRKLYYSLPKRTCHQPLNSTDCNFVCSPSVNGCIDYVSGNQEEARLVTEPSLENHIRGDCIPNQFGLQETDVDGKGSIGNNLIHTVSEKVPSWSAKESVRNSIDENGKIIKDALQALGENVNELRNYQSVQGVPQSHASPDKTSLLHATGGSSPSPGLPLWKTIEDISAPSMLADVSHGDKAKLCSSYDVHLMPVGVSESDMDVDDKTAFSLKTSDNVCQKDVPMVQEPQNFDACPVKAKMSSPTTIPYMRSLELDDEMECVFNTMDPEILCNGHILPRKSFAYSGIRKPHAEPGILGSSFASRRKTLGQKESHKPESLLLFKMGGSSMSKVSGNVQHGHGVKKEFPDDEHYSAASAQAKTGHGVPTQYRPATLAPNSAANVKVNTEPLHAKENSITKNISKPEANPLHLELEESLLSEESENGDIPCFSDIEAMILEMDLFPDEPGSCISKEVTLKYRDESTRRSIIRLEQGAQSSMQRCIASKGAFAVFYGRHLKYYIKETEVVLGRSTDEYEVDIDLRREGHASKISRQQALIKLKSDGSFTLKNLGKNSIYLNGMELPTSHVASLSSSSLIEIKDFSFIFEINRRAVKRYTSMITEGNCKKKANFEWSEEGIP